MSEFAGKLTQRIEIWQRSEQRLASGASSDVLVQLASCLARVDCEGSGNATEGMAMSAMPRFKVLIRALEGIKLDQQLRWKGRQLVIRQIVDDPSLPDRLLLRCEEQR